MAHPSPAPARGPLSDWGDRHVLHQWARDDSAGGLARIEAGSTTILVRSPLPPRLSLRFSRRFLVLGLRSGASVVPAGEGHRAGVGEVIT